MCESNTNPCDVVAGVRSGTCITSGATCDVVAESFTDRIIQACADQGEYAEVTSTGGNCRAIVVRYGSGELLITDADASLPRPGQVMIVDYADDDDSDDRPTRIMTTADPDRVADVVHTYLHLRRWGL